MSERIVNPFQNIDIYVPAAWHADIQRYSRRSAKEPDHSPFRRMVDFWFFTVCVGVAKGLEPVELGPKPVKIIDGGILGSEGWRVNLLMLVAIGRSADVSIVVEPRRVILLASGIAAAAMPEVIGMLRDGKAEPIWNLSDSMERLLEQGGHAR